MRGLYWWLAIGALLCLLVGLALGACDDDDDDDCTTDVEEVCDYIFANCDDHWGWPSIDLCYSDFMTDCADEAAYFACACQCYDFGDCENFTGCEADCWAGNCE
jgi:hypothetical protein